MKRQSTSSGITIVRPIYLSLALCCLILTLVDRTQATGDTVENTQVLGDVVLEEVPASNIQVVSTDSDLTPTNPIALQLANSDYLQSADAYDDSVEIMPRYRREAKGK